MKKLFVTIILLLLISAPSFASPTYMFDYMMTEVGNDQDTNALEILINNWFTDNDILYQSDLEFLYKLEAENADDTGLAEDGFSFTWGDDHTVGTWESPVPVKFFSVKGSDAYAVYWNPLKALEGTFSTEMLRESPPDLSHISFYTNDNIYGESLLLGGGLPTPTPEPTTSLLFGLGLLGLVGLVRRKQK